MGLLTNSVCGVVVGLVSLPAYCASSITERAGNWLVEKLAVTDSLDVSFTKTKISFKGCKQREYRLAFLQQVTSTMEVEAIAHYEEGKLDFGLTDQKVSSQAYELVSWWQLSGYRLGVGRKILAQHEIFSPLAAGVLLPKSDALAVYLEFPGLSDTHTMSLSAVQESWTAQEEMSLSWHTSKDNQLNLSYRVNF